MHTNTYTCTHTRTHTHTRMHTHICRHAHKHTPHSKSNDVIYITNAWLVGPWYYKIEWSCTWSWGWLDQARSLRFWTMFCCFGPLQYTVEVLTGNVMDHQFIFINSCFSNQFNTLLHYYWCLPVHLHFTSYTREVTFLMYCLQNATLEFQTGTWFVHIHCQTILHWAT